MRERASGLRLFARLRSRESGKFKPRKTVYESRRERLIQRGQKKLPSHRRAASEALKRRSVLRNRKRRREADFGLAEPSRQSNTPPYVPWSSTDYPHTLVSTYRGLPLFLISFSQIALAYVRCTSQRGLFQPISRFSLLETIQLGRIRQEGVLVEGSTRQIRYTLVPGD